MNQTTLDFVRRHADCDVRQLALLGRKEPEVDLPWALDQIAGRQTARQKLPTWAATEGIVYPPRLSMEQCSSEQTARYKAALAGRGRRLVDLTGGFGVDFAFMARAFDEAVYVEHQAQLCECASTNLKCLGLHHAVTIFADSIEFLRSMEHADLVYVDPARRNEHGGRTYAISDCTPDVAALRELLLQKADRVLVKLSPMLDWRKAVADMGRQWVRQVHIVSVGGECKELLLLLGPGSGLRLVCANDDEVFEVEQEKEAAVGEVLTVEQQKNVAAGVETPAYLYEPNASIMKAGCFREVAARYGVGQIAPNSHLYVSDRYVADFPGRKFAVSAVSSMNKRELRQRLEGLAQANLAVRNFPQTVAELRKRLKLSEGGSTYIFATTLADGSHALFFCRKTDGSETL